MESPGGRADTVVAIPDVVADDADAHEVPDGQGWDVHDPVDPVNVPERFPALLGSSWKSLPVPLKLFDCLALIPH
jgi:hypothetical protein